MSYNTASSEYLTEESDIESLTDLANFLEEEDDTHEEITNIDDYYDFIVKQISSSQPSTLSKTIKSLFIYYNNTSYYEIKEPLVAEEIDPIINILEESYKHDYLLVSDVEGVEPTRLNILLSIKWLFSRVEEGDLLLLYCNGTAVRVHQI